MTAWWFFLIAIAFVVFATRLGKNAAGQPFVRNPLMPQLVLGYAARILKTGVLFMAVACVVVIVALGIRLNPGDWMHKQQPLPGAAATGTLNVHFGVHAVLVPNPWLP